MDSLKWVLFESPLVLGAVCALVLFVLLVRWRSGGRARSLLVGLGVTALLLSTQAIVVTPREHARRIMQQVERGVLESRVEMLAETLSERFHVPNPDWNKEDFLEMVRQRMRQIRVHSLTRRAFEIEQKEPAPSRERFVLEVSYLADIGAPNYEGGVLSRWRITFTSEADAWRIVDIQPIKLNTTVVRGWRGMP